MIAAEFHNVGKRYGETVALDAFSLAIPQGSVFGLVGQNGAGKSTAVRILLGLIRPTSGSVALFDGDQSKRISYLPDVPGFYGWMSARAYLEFIAGMLKVPDHEQQPRIDALLEMAGLAGVNTPIGGYSRGMRQRLGIAQALVTSPDLLVLDEPTSALDPLGRREVLDLMAALRGRTTILFSSHILEDVERVADQFAILHRSHLIASGTLTEIRAAAQIQPHLEIEVLSNVSEFAAMVSEQPWVTSIASNGSSIQIHVSDTTAAMTNIPRIAADLGCGIARFAHVEPSLEDAFLKLTRGAV